MAKSSGTLGEAYAGLGTARRDAVKSQRFHNTFGNALEAGADLAFTASDHLEEKAQYEGEFESTQNMLGGDAKVVNLKTGGKWEDKTLFGRGDKESYLNPFSGDKGLRVGDTLYDDVDITAISRSDEYLGIDKNDEGKLKSYRDNMASVYGKNISETEWGKTELDSRKTVAEEHVDLFKQGADAKMQRDIFNQPEATQIREEKQEEFLNVTHPANVEAHLQHQKDLQAQMEASRGLSESQTYRKEGQEKIDAAGKKAYDKAYAEGKAANSLRKDERQKNPTEKERREDLRKDLEARFFPRVVKQAGQQAYDETYKSWEPLLERSKNLQKMQHGEERIAEKASIWEEFLSKSMNNE